jgi:hypothetical protein
VSFATINLCVASQRAFIVLSVYFVIDSVRKLSDTPSYNLIRIEINKMHYRIFVQCVVRFRQRNYNLVEAHVAGGHAC